MFLLTVLVGPSDSPRTRPALECSSFHSIFFLASKTRGEGKPY